MLDAGWRYTLVTGATGDQTVLNQAAYVQTVRVAGATALAGAVIIKDGTVTLETLPVATPVGAQREYGGVQVLTKLIINLASAADTILVIWQAA